MFMDSILDMPIDSEILNSVLNTTSSPFSFSQLNGPYISSVQETGTLSCFSFSKPYFLIN